MDDVGGILGLLADLAPGAARERLDVTAGGDFAWLGTDPWPAEPGAGALPELANDEPPDLSELSVAPVRAAGLHALAQLDATHDALPMLRQGWVYLVGPVTRGDATTRVVVPLVERTVVLGSTPSLRRRGEPAYRVEPRGPWDISPLVEDPAAASALEARIPLGGGALGTGTPPSRELVVRLGSLTSWIREVTEAMGVPGVEIREPIDPRTVTGDEVVAVVGFGVHVAVAVDRLDLRSSLRAWSGQRLGTTALHHAYGLCPPVAAADRAGGREEVWSSLVLSAAQADVVRRSRTEPITVVSGPPGTGKSHTAVAVARDAVARGERVLVATRSAEAADVVGGLLERVPGPDPVLFGGGVRAARVASRLSEGLARPDDDDIAARYARALERWGAAVGAVDRILQGVERWERYRDIAAEVPAHAGVAPAWFDGHADLAEAARLLEIAEQRADGWRWRADRAARQVRDHAGAATSIGLARLREAWAVAEVRQAATTVVPTVAEGRWAELDTADAALRSALGESLAETVRNRVENRHTRAVAALASALRAGRGQRRRHLRNVDTAWLTEALPLWVGTLGDIEELLPQEPAMFDLVVLDEASQIDQPTGAVALLRGRRAVVVGDPHQLRFVSFVADQDVRERIVGAGLAAYADRLDVRRTSAFDLAAGAAPVTLLDEHYRGPAHLVGFSARRFYGGRLHVATRHPATEVERHIDVRVVDGRRTADGTNPVEVAAVLAVLAEVREAAGAGGTPTIGVVTPFRAQAEAIWDAVREVWDVAAIEAARLRVGTVHAFQGDERDVVVVATGVGPDGDGLRFVEDPNLFNVMVTRARRRVVVVTSCPEPRPGLLRDYLAWAASPPPPPVLGAAETLEPWTAAVARALEAGGVVVRTRDPVGREHVDLVVGEGAAATAVETVVHPAGPAAHRRRHLALRRSGWAVVDAFAARVDGDAVAAAVDLAARTGERVSPS